MIACLRQSRFDHWLAEFVAFLQQKRLNLPPRRAKGPQESPNQLENPLLELDGQPIVEDVTGLSQVKRHGHPPLGRRPCLCSPRSVWVKYGSGEVEHLRIGIIGRGRYFLHIQLEFQTGVRTLAMGYCLSGEA